MADEIMTTEEQELFQLSNGRYIMDKDLSQKMFYIKESKPERSHQISGTRLFLGRVRHGGAVFRVLQE